MCPSEQLYLIYGFEVLVGKFDSLVNILLKGRLKRTASPRIKLKRTFLSSLSGLI